MITLRRAKEIALQAVAPHWSHDLPMYVEDEQWEDERAYAINITTRGWAIDHDLRGLILGAPLVLVDKETGKPELTAYLVVCDRIDRMTPVSGL